VVQLAATGAERVPGVARWWMRSWETAEPSDKARLGDVIRDLMRVAKLAKKGRQALLARERLL